MNSKSKSFNALCAQARRCRKCAALCDKTAVLSELNGNIEAKILFVAEAPGRQGADRTRVPFSGDKSGANLDKFLASIDLPRTDIIITNAVLCSPRKESGANRKPTKLEINNCSEFLRRTIEVIDPEIIVTLGAVSLEALKAIEYHQYSLKSHVGAVIIWNGRLLVPLYHPSPQVLASHRRESEQLNDYNSLAKAIERKTLDIAADL